ncbi:P-loop ATPase, Sll1717 family [Mesorhizobium sp. CN2-181]|uniref:P-loop ATPase, Sll1717 family n=1 Tax=Mesorhizobium yinganensis TaxID=3157707 RepID=UPI0032B83F91
MADEQISVKSVLSRLKIGRSVAEFDDDLEEYFVETDTFQSIVEGGHDIVAGDKGTGKTAIYRMISKNYRSYSILDDTELLAAFNPQGNPIFQRLGQIPEQSEGQYRTLWKAYFFSLAGNWVLDIFGEDYNEEVKSLAGILEKTGLRNLDPNPSLVFETIVGIFTKLKNFSAAEVTGSVTEYGLPIITSRAEFNSENKDISVVYSDVFLKSLNDALRACDIKLWILLDRLDEAFQGYQSVEIPALRALFRTYLDMTELDFVRLKLFVRKDLFRKITQGGFVNLTHINAKKVEIVWEEEDLLNMLCRRIRKNDSFLTAIAASEEASDKEIFYSLFPEQVDSGTRKPDTLTWIMARIRDGNSIRPPRNLIDLMLNAMQAQFRREERDGRVFSREDPLIESDSLRKAQKQLSADRVQDTLFAEAAGDLVPYLELFRDQKAEHNKQTIAALFGQSENEAMPTIRRLIELGFLEEIGASYKIPMLYREGLNITQGKAF